MSEKILEKMEDLIEKAIDEATKNLTGGNRGVDNKDWHEDVKAIARLVDTSSEIVANAIAKDKINKHLFHLTKDFGIEKEGH